MKQGFEAPATYYYWRQKKIYADISYLLIILVKKKALETPALSCLKYWIILVFVDAIQN